MLLVYCIQECAIQSLYCMHKLKMSNLASIDAPGSRACILHTAWPVLNSLRWLIGYLYSSSETDSSYNIAKISLKFYICYAKYMTGTAFIASWNHRKHTSSMHAKRHRASSIASSSLVNGALRLSVDGVQCCSSHLPADDCWPRVRAYAHERNSSTAADHIIWSFTSEDCEAKRSLRLLP